MREKGADMTSILCQLEGQMDRTGDEGAITKKMGLFNQYSFNQKAFEGSFNNQVDKVEQIWSLSNLMRMEVENGTKNLVSLSEIKLGLYIYQDNQMKKILKIKDISNFPLISWLLVRKNLFYLLLQCPLPMMSLMNSFFPSNASPPLHYLQNNSFLHLGVTVEHILMAPIRIQVHDRSGTAFNLTKKFQSVNFQNTGLKLSYLLIWDIKIPQFLLKQPLQFSFAFKIFIIKLCYQQFQLYLSSHYLLTMSNINLWNTIALAQTGRIKLRDSGQELFGTVIRHGINDKTVTVRVSSRHYNEKYKKFLYNTKKKQVHDEHNYCVTGDRVIISRCVKVSQTKAYFIKTIVNPVPRLILEKKQQAKTEQVDANVKKNEKKLQGSLEKGKKREEKSEKKNKQKSVGKQRKQMDKERKKEDKQAKSKEKPVKKQSKKADSLL